jgi:DNA-binding transcriptional ArsR family regulator
MFPPLCSMIREHGVAHTDGVASRTSGGLRHPEPEEIEFPAVMAALSDPVRLAIVAALDAHDQLPCSAFELAVAKSTRSWHFRVLREAGILRQRDQGTRRLNSLRREDLETRFPGLLDLALVEARRSRLVVLAGSF